MLDGRGALGGLMVRDTANVHEKAPDSNHPSWTLAVLTPTLTLRWWVPANKASILAQIYPKLCLLDIPWLSICYLVLSTSDKLRYLTHSVPAEKHTIKLNADLDLGDLLFTIDSLSGIWDFLNPVYREKNDVKR